MSRMQRFLVLGAALALSGGFSGLSGATATPSEQSGCGQWEVKGGGGKPGDLDDDGNCVQGTGRCPGFAQ